MSEQSPCDEIRSFHAQLTERDAEIAELQAEVEKLKAERDSWAGIAGTNAGEAELLKSCEVVAAEKLARAIEWIESAPHGDNCFVSDHYEGDPGNRCNCGKDSIVEYLNESQPQPLPGEPT